MYQLRSLLWKAYKVRLRSPLTTALDVGGPIMMIVLYLLVKVILGLNSNLSEGDIPVANRTISRPLDVKDDLPKLICPKVLFFSNLNELGASATGARQRISQECNLQLVDAASRDDLVRQLSDSLNRRIKHVSSEGKNLNRLNLSAPYCLMDSGEPVYQIGLVLLSNGDQPDQSSTIELHSTESLELPVLNQPYTLGSTYNEYRLPHSDLNSGLFLIEFCLSKALSLVARTASGSTNETGRIIDTGKSQSLKLLNFGAFPVTADATVLPTLFLVFQLTGNLCNALATVMRTTDDNESGLHHYIRMSGVPAGIYWSSQMIVIIIHMTIQSLVFAALLAISVADSILWDPICETTITVRWLILLTYSLAINANALLVGSLFARTSHATLCSCLLAVSYSMYPIMFMLQWSPYGFSRFGYLPELTLLNPASNYMALMVAFYSIALQSNEPFQWNQSWTTHILGGGMTDWSVASLWSLLIGQMLLWFLLTILFDHYYYSSSGGIFSYLYTLVNDVICCNYLSPKSDNNPQKSGQKSASLASAAAAAAAESKSKPLNPNRICCSIRHLSVFGPTTLVAHTKGDPLKLTPEQLQRLHQANIDHENNNNNNNGNHDKQIASKSHQFIVKRSSSLSKPGSAQYGVYLDNNNNAASASAAAAAAAAKEEPIILDEVLQQHIIWHKTNIHFEDLNLDFRFNQVSFVLGQTDYKELFFQTLLGLRSLQSGSSVTIDETQYGPNSISLARSQIGFLGERDIFLNEMTIFENLQFFGSLRDSAYTQYDSESQYVLSLLHLTSRKDMLPMLLTNRSARKLALAAASVGHTKLLLLVEPTLSLRWKPRCQVLNLLKKYKSIRSIVVDTSDVDEATAFGDRIVLFKNSRAFLDGSPQRLAKKLACGHWIVFEPTPDGQQQQQQQHRTTASIKSTITTDNLKSLEQLTSNIFKQDKLERLDATQRSVYQELMKSAINESGSRRPKEDLSDMERHFNETKLHRTILILKVQHSASSNQALCSLLKLFNSGARHGFRLAEITYESLEDVLVMNMAKAFYPDLPPDLLLSLQHRTSINNNDPEQPAVSVRRYSGSQYNKPKLVNPIYGMPIGAIIKDRLSAKSELYLHLAVLALAIVWLSGALILLQSSVYLPSIESTAVKPAHATHLQPVLAEHFYKNRFGLHLRDGGNSSRDTYLNKWTAGSKRSAIIVAENVTKIDALYVATSVQRSRNQAAGFVMFDARSNEATLFFEPHQPRALWAGIKLIIDYNDRLARVSESTNASNLSINLHHFRQPWHEAIRGYLNRRMAYGLGITFAEGMSLGVLILAPLRHRQESKSTRIRTFYWLAMLLFDMIVCFFQACGYALAMTIIDGTSQWNLVISNILVLLLFKLATIPISYLIAMVVTSRLNGFVFIVFLNICLGWSFSVHLRTFVEWTLIGEGYLYTIASWIILSMPLSSLIDGLTVINHIGRMDNLCPQVPAYTATSNLLDLAGPQRISVVDKLISKVRECLESGKKGISTDVLHPTKFGIIYDIYFLLLFVLVGWIFLLFSDRVFGILARRFSSQRSSSDPLKNIIRTTEPTHSLYKWDREKDRLVSEYIRCMNEAKYVKIMANNCLYIRIWLRPMSDQSSIDKRLALILEPLGSLGQPKNDIQIELKTTLQVFVRVGSESNRHKMDRIQLIETYAKFVKDHSDITMKFALLDWTRETLYKILLHGHYNTKSSTAVT